MDKDAARARIGKLVENFQAVKKRSLSEDEVCRGFVLPMFDALGWDTSNIAEVSGQESIAGKRADYGFYLNGQPVFYVEAKKFKVDLTDVEFVRQAINYAWLRGISWAILTNFERTRLFIAEELPQKGEEERAQFWIDVRAEALLENFEDVWLLSKGAMLERRLDKQAIQANRKPHPQSVNTIEKQLSGQFIEWRDLLQDQFNQWNEQAPFESIDSAVQRLIDRLIFIRTMEDRGVESARSLESLVRRAGKRDVFSELQTHFRAMDAIYDSNLFEKSPVDRLQLPEPDLVTKLIRSLYDVPNSFAKYDFREISVDVLGRVYEDYLGDAQRTREERKQESHIKTRAQERTQTKTRKQQKRKKQGIYYTPPYIVRYIVQQTLGKLLDSGRDPHSIRVLDPACGSGAFLIEAFNVLDRWIARVEPEVSNVERRRRILLENIYGVDLDAQAVEITRLNLVIRAAAAREELPRLSNIKHGNSLIEDDAIAGQGLGFNWQERYSEVLDKGGFDVVVGNPPYIRTQNMPQTALNWMSEYYETAVGNYDIYIPFVERGLSVLNPQGLLGFILPHKFFNAQYGKNLRGLIARGKHLREVVHFGDQQVFEGATTYTAILVLGKKEQEQVEFEKVENLEKWQNKEYSSKWIINNEQISENEWNFSSDVNRELFEKLNAVPLKLETVTSRIFQGLKTSADKIYIVKEIRREAKRVRIYSEEKQAEYWLETDLLHPLVKGGDSHRYHLSTTQRLILFPYVRDDRGVMNLVAPSMLETEYPLTWAYLCDNKTYLENREKGKMRGEKWYGYIYPKSLDVISVPKIFTPDIAPVSSFSLDTTGKMYFTGGTAGGYGIIVLPDYPREYILGLLNSKLLQWFLQHTSTSMRGGWFSYEAKYIRHLPIKYDPADTARHDRMVALVETMLHLKREYAAADEAGNSDRRDDLHARIDATDKAIDALVYELYGLTGEEIAIVEGE